MYIYIHAYIIYTYQGYMFPLLIDKSMPSTCIVLRATGASVACACVQADLDRLGNLSALSYTNKYT